MTEDNLLQVRDLKIAIGTVPVVGGVSFEIKPGETLGIVGESGCGKTMTALAVAGLLKKDQFTVKGQLYFAGRPLQEHTGGKIGIMFQNAFAALNPVLTVQKHLTQLLRYHFGGTTAGAEVKALKLLRTVGIEPAEEIMGKYPWELSGGMQQRVALAMALGTKPDILIADEPTTSIDNLTGATILETLVRLRDQVNLATIIISHDLAVVAQVCDRVLVMYMGKVVEEGPLQEVFTRPLHPYTRKLVKTFEALEAGRHEIEPISGQVPDYNALPEGCSFHLRCEAAQEKCFAKEPELICLPGKRKVACYAAECDH